MARNIKFGRGSASVELSTDLQGWIGQVISRTMPAVADRIEKDASDLRKAAQEKWPVKSGRSRDAFDDGLRIVEGGGGYALEGYVDNNAGHTYMVKSDQNGLNGKHAWTVLVRKPFQTMAVQLGEDLGDIIRRKAQTAKAGA